MAPTTTQDPAHNAHSSKLATETFGKNVKESWMKPVLGFFDEIGRRPAMVISISVVLLAVVAGIAMYLNHEEARGAAANSAFFQAQKTFEAETKTFSESLKPAAPAKPEKKDKKDKKDTAPPAAPDVTFRKTDVDATFSGSVKKFKAVGEEFPGTRAAYEANLSLGSLYFNHGEATKAITWYDKAVQSAPKSFDKALALSSLGYAQENSGKYSDAIQSFEKSMNLGEAGMKGELLLSIARCYELMKDTAKARSTYDQVISQLPNTDQAKTAELLKGQLH